MEMKDIMEILFNVFYLIAIWGLVFVMSRKLQGTNQVNTSLRKLFTLAFGFLALGDTGHVGFRVLAYLKGGIAENASLVGVGKMATAFTVTIFYAILVEIWRVRFNKEHNLFTKFLFLCAILRAIIVLFPQNQWGSTVAPADWEAYRNIPLMVQGFGVVYLYLKDGIKNMDKVFQWTSVMILISFGFYIPVILFASKIPTIGLLMIPKTIAYLAAAFIAYGGVFRSEVSQITVAQ